MKTSTTVSQLVKRVALSCIIAFAFIANTNAQITVTGSNGLNATYTSFTKSGGLFAALNGGASQSGMNITVSITADVTTEDSTNALNAGAWTSITITPSGVRTISGAVAGSLIRYNGADNVTINGLNSGGNALTISNTNAAASGVFRLYNDASNNTITNCTITGSGNVVTSGIIWFGTGVTTGNDGNTVSNNSITAAGTNYPANGILSTGTSTSVDNSGNTISGNNIFNIFSATVATNAILINATGNNTWTISSNKIYQTASRTFTTGNTHSGINILGGDGYSVSNNTIGYASSSATGTYTMLGSVATRFTGINLTVGTTTATSVQGNTIANFNITSANSSSTTTPSFSGVFINAGNVNLGTTTGNTIGSNSSAHSVVVNTTASSGGIVGIYCGSTGTININSTTMGGLTDTSATASNVLGIYCIYIGSATTSLTISNCTLGNTVANNIIAGRLGFTTGACNVAGIAAPSTPASLNYNNNTIQNLTGYGATTSGFTKGIYTTTSGTTTAATIYNNTIRNLLTYSALTSYTSALNACTGIQFAAGLNATIYGNTINGLNYGGTATTNVVVSGIALAAASQTKVYRNRIYDIRNNGKSNISTTPNVAVGIMVRGGTTNDSIYNNMISLGNGDTTNAAFTGIMLQMGSSACNSYIYYNTINIEGTVSNSNGAMLTAAFLHGDYATTIRLAPVVDIRNNIFTNTRSGGLGKHYAIGNNINVTSGTIATVWASNNNLLYASNSSNIGYWLADKNFSGWKTSASGDANSTSNNLYTYTNSANDLHINMGTSVQTLESQGTSISTITTDFDGDPRPGPTVSNNGGGVFPDVGADEFDGTITYSCDPAAAPNSVVPTPASVSCNGSTVLLTLGTAISTTGNTYQWQYSTNGTTGWTNISGATNDNYTATIAALNNYYRCGITCANGGGAVYSTSSANITGVAPLAAGTYTINSGAATGGSNYNTFTDAFTDLNCKGIAGAVVFNVSGGPFVEQVTLNAVAGSSATNTITINGNGRTLSFSSSTSTARAGITLNGADYVTIDNLVIDASAGTYGWGIHFINGADYNTISNCNITTSTISTTSTNCAAIMFSASASGLTAGTTGSNNNITGNTLKGGYYAVCLYSGSTAPLYATGNIVSNNTIQEFYFYGVYAIYQKFATITGNDISRPTRTTSSTTYGIILSTGGEGSLVAKNRVHNLFDGFASTHTNATYGLYVAATGTSAFPNRVINNLVYNIAGNGTTYGLYMGGAYSKFYHNTLVLNNASTTAVTYAAYGATTAVGVELVNNILYVTRGGTGAKYCIYLSSAPVGLISNYNDLYISGGSNNSTGYYSATPYTTLADWKTANSNAFDQNSFAANPQFVDAINNDFTPNSSVFDNGGTNVGVTDDILANSRSSSTPDMGAIEFTGAGCTDPPTAGTATSSATFACTGVSFTLDVSGNSSGSSQEYQWQFSTDNTNWTDVGSSQTTTSFITNQSVEHYYRVAITCSGGTTVYSTSVYVNTPSTIAGTYTINKNAAASSTNFQSITSAINAMGCGITGAVVFNVVAASGPYNEKLTIPAISGASATNTITFNGNGNTIYNKIGTSAAPTAITLNGADYIRLNNFTINVADSTYGWGVLFINAADNNIISNCTILTSTTLTSGHYPIVFSGSASSATTSGNSGNYNTVTGCTLTGGAYNVSLIGNSTTAAENIGNTISNNIMTDAYIYSMYILYQKDLTIRSNNISRPTRTASSTISGMYMSTSAGGGYLIEKNIIHNMNDMQPNSTSTCYGIFVAADAASFATANKVQNNLIYNLGGNGPIYGIYNSAGEYNQIYHNTIALNDNTATSGAAYGIYQTSAATVDIKNNNVVVSRTGTGIKRCLYFGTTTSTITCNYNNLSMSSAGAADTILAQFGTTGSFNFANLAAWKTANGGSFDQNSYSTNPAFIDVANNNYKPTAAILNNKGINVGTTADLLDSTRSNTTPDIGAYEFDIPTCSGTPSAGTVVVSSNTVCSGNSLTLDATGNTTGLGITYQWQSSTNNSTWTDFGASLESVTLDTIQNATRYYRLEAICSGGGIGYSTSVLVTTPALVSGTFTINAAQSTGGTNFASFADAISYIGCGINGPVVFNVQSGSGPYNEQVTIPDVNGTSVTNTITFNGNGETLSFNSSNASNRVGIILNGVDHVTINNLVIDGSAGTYGWGILLTNAADSNTITNCTINVSTTNITSGNHYCIVISGSSTSISTSGNNGNYNTISNNTLNGGYYVVAMYGSTTAANVGNKLLNNTIKDSYAYSVYALYQSTATISGNDISRPTRTASTTTAGLFISTGDINCMISKNKIHNMFDGFTTPSTSVNYNIYVAADGAVGQENYFINNIVYACVSNGTQYGIYNTTGTYMRAYHNTIVLDDPTTTTTATYGIYQTGAAAGIDVKNNNIQISRGGTGIKRCLAFVTNTSTVASNNNNLYLNAAAGTDNNIGAWGTTAYATLTNWRTANSNAFDQNSVSVNPVFVNLAGGNLRPTASAVNTVGANVGVADDILGTLRGVTFTAGAYQNDVSGPAISYTALTSDCNVSSSATRTISGVTITDASGITTSGSNMPKIYYKKGLAGTWVSTAGSLTSGTATSSVWSFTINNNNLPTLSIGDSIFYFVVAQDVSSNTNIGSSPTGAAGASVNSLTTYPTPNYYRLSTVTPAVSISTTKDTVCSGNTVVFTANSTTGGPSPSYVWYKNSISAGTGSTITFLAGTLNTGDIISCILTANNTCQTASTAASNNITLTVLPSPTVGTSTGGATVCALGSTRNVYNTNTNGGGVWSTSDANVATVVTQNGATGVVTLVGVGTAQITYSKAGLGRSSGCVSASSTTMIVQPATPPNAITGTNSICKNFTTTLSNTTPSGTWSSQNAYATVNSGGLVTGLNAGTAVILYTITNANGCTASSSYNVTVNPIPNVPTIAYAAGTTNPQNGSGGLGWCTNRTFTVVGSPAAGSGATGVWSSTGVITVGSGTGIVNTGATPGSGVTLKYTYTSAAGCVNSRTITGNVVGCASRSSHPSTDDSQPLAADFTVYPNPAHSFISLNVDKLVGAGSIIITDLYGKQIKTQPLSMGANTVNIASFSKGFYMISIITTEGKTTKKLVVE